MRSAARLLASATASRSAASQLAGAAAMRRRGSRASVASIVGSSVQCSAATSAASGCRRARAAGRTSPGRLPAAAASPRGAAAARSRGPAGAAPPDVRRHGRFQRRGPPAPRRRRGSAAERVGQLSAMSHDSSRCEQIADRRGGPAASASARAARRSSLLSARRLPAPVPWRPLCSSHVEQHFDRVGQAGECAGGQDRLRRPAPASPGRA